MTKLGLRPYRGGDDPLAGSVPVTVVVLTRDEEPNIPPVPYFGGGGGSGGSGRLRLGGRHRADSAFPRSCDPAKIPGR
jgi:hypothetical protein